MATPPFFEGNLDLLPKPGDLERAAREFERWNRAVSSCEVDFERQLAEQLTEHPEGHRLLEAIFSNSPFLTQCAMADVPFLARLLSEGPAGVFADVLEKLRTLSEARSDRELVMRKLRIARRETALLVAVADLTGHWSLEQTTEALSDFADAAVSASLSHLLGEQMERGYFRNLDPDMPEEGCGYVVLAMGKHGARELNYSSDIDLIALYDPTSVDFEGPRGLEAGLVRLTQQLVRMLSERTGDGYVCRVDFRLRPDPSATPLAVTYGAAATYYEQRGRDWERAAMIKARPIAGDLALGRQFLEELGPFIWRERLDFWAMRAIHSMKRLIDEQHDRGDGGIEGRNVKLGRGGIREVEFAAQALQLTYGGRDPYVRSRKTVDALSTLAEAGWIAHDCAEDLIECYEFLRCVEHRLQMVEDQQTQTLPADEVSLGYLAAFLGFSNLSDFRVTLLDYLDVVARHYGTLLGGTPAHHDVAELEFSEGEPAPKTVETLRTMSYQDPESAAVLVSGRLTAGLPASPDERVPELLSALMPVAIERIGRMPDPDDTLQRFDDLLCSLEDPGDVLAMFCSDAGLTETLIDVLAKAPSVAREVVGKRSSLETLAIPSFGYSVPERSLMAADCVEMLRDVEDLNTAVARCLEWSVEQRTRIRLGALRHTLNAHDAGLWLGRLLTAVIQGLSAYLAPQQRNDIVTVVLGEFAHGEATVHSVAELAIFVGDEHPELQLAAKRYVEAIENGMSVPVQVLYFAIPRDPGPQSSGAFEEQLGNLPLSTYLALVGARVISGPSGLAQRVTEMIRSAPLNVQTESIREVQIETWREQPAFGPISELEDGPGGLTELYHLGQSLQLKHGTTFPALFDDSPLDVFPKLCEKGVLDVTGVSELGRAAKLLREVRAVLHASMVDRKDVNLTKSLELALARAGGEPDYESLKSALIETMSAVRYASKELLIKTRPADH